MRKIDKRLNILKANILMEQIRLRDNGYLREIEDMDMAYKFLTEADVETDNVDVDTEKDSKSEFETTDASSFRVRFNLSNDKDKMTGKGIYMTWKIEPNGKTGYLGDDVLSFNPNELVDKVSNGGVRNNFNGNEFNLKFRNCSLINSPSTAYQIKCHLNKTPISYLECSDVSVNLGGGSAGSPETQLIYNPRMVPYWLMMSSTELFEMANNEPIQLGKEKMEIKKYEDGLIYESCVSVQKGEDDKMPPSKYYYVQNGGERYVKVVEPSVDSYKSSGRIYKIVDGMKFSNAYTSGNKIYLG